MLGRAALSRQHLLYAAKKYVSVPVSNQHYFQACRKGGGFAQRSMTSDIRRSGAYTP